LTYMTTITASGVWELISVTATAPAGAVTMEFVVSSSTNNITFRVANRQLEQRPTATSWTLGGTTRPDNYSGTPYRQVSFFDLETAELSLTNTHIVKGSGAARLYLPFEDVYAATVIDTTTGSPVVAATSTATNVLTTTPVTDVDKDYRVSYKLNKSFTADHENVTSGENRTRIQIANASTPASYEVAYEKADYDSASTIPVPLHSFYTSVDEGFLFLSHEEYPLATVDVYLSPSKIVSDGEDYMMITLRSLDEHGNPKPYQSVTLTSTFGKFPNNTGTTVLQTDVDGAAAITLTSTAATNVLSGTLTTSGTGIVNSVLTFQVDPPVTSDYRLVAVTSAREIPADGESQITVFGKLEDATRQPVANANILWRKGRSVPEAFAATASSIATDSVGRFVIGPLTASEKTDPGYWFVVAETEGKYLNLTGAASTYANTPHSASLIATTAIDVRARILPADWTPATAQTIVAKYSTAGQRAWFLDLAASGVLSFSMSTDGTAGFTGSSTVNLSTASTTKPLWVRVTRTSSTGITTFYTSEDGTNWTQLGATVVVAAGSNIFAGTDSLRIGIRQNGGLFIGKVYDFELRTAINGTPVAKPLFEQAPETDAYGNLWTLTGAATIAGANTAGDVVFWLEHPDHKYGANDTNTLPIQLVQMRDTPHDYPHISDDNKFPVQYDESDPQGTVSPVTIDYTVPKWYAINRYKQYQLGFLGTGFYSVDLSLLGNAHPDYKDV
jgi:hypothetical protein